MDLLDMLVEHRQVETFVLAWFPAHNPNRFRVRCTCGHTMSILSWVKHLEKHGALP